MPALADTADKVEALRAAIQVEEDPDRLNALMIALRDELHDDWRETPAAMANTLTRGEFKVYAYIDLLSHQFARAQSGEQPRQIWNLPSRLGKTTMLKWGAVWTYDKTEGRAKIIYVCYGMDLARDQSTDIRDWLEIYGSDLHGQLRQDRRRHDRFVTETGGGLLAAGFDGTIIGFGAGNGGGVIVDDPFKNWQEAHSAARRLHVVNTFKSGIRTRLDHEEDWIIVVHHRMHQNDLTGELVDDTMEETGDEWVHICLPAIAVAPSTNPSDPPAFRAPDPLGRQPGDVLEPQRFTLEAALARARGMGTYLASAMEQQRPTAEAGNELLREWFMLATEAELPRRPDRAITSWDLKLKDREAGDFVVGQVWWAVGNARFLMDQIRGQYDHAATANAIALLAYRHPECTRHVVEAAGSADEVLPELRIPQPYYEISMEMGDRLGMNIEERQAVEQIRRSGMGNLDAEPIAEGKKPVRAREYIAGPAEAGNVRFPASARWVPGLLDEIAAFPRGDHDDQVDAMSQALKRLRVPVGKPGARRAVGTIER